MKKKQLIEKYFQNALTTDEQAAFEDLLISDTVFAKEVAFQKDAQQAIIASEDAAFKKMLQEFEPKSNRRQIYVRTMLIAASFALLFSLGYGLFFSTPSNTTLFAENFKAYPNTIEPIVRGNTVNDLKTLAFIAYENKAYIEAKEKFEELYLETEEAYTLFFGGVCDLALKNPENAEQLFTQYINLNESQFATEARWYLSLSYLQMNNKNKAVKELKTLTLSQNNYTKQAKKLLSDLK